MISPCGIDCSACDILRAPQVPEISARLVSWFQKNGHPDANASWFHCCGCPPVDKTQHWSSDCAIMLCVEQKGLRYCSECQDFVCPKLEEFAARGEKYRQAVARLEEMRKNS